MKNFYTHKTLVSDTRDYGRIGSTRNPSLQLDNNCMDRNCQVTVLEFQSLLEGLQVPGKGLNVKSWLISINFSS